MTSAKRWRKMTETRWLTETFPSGVHTRPEGAGNDILMLWEYQTKLMEPVDAPKMDEQYPEVALRGTRRHVATHERVFCEDAAPTTRWRLLHKDA